MKLSTGTRRIWAYDLEKWWRSMSAKDFPHRGAIRPINSDQAVELTEPERLLSLAEAARRCGIQTGEIWRAFWDGQIGLVVLGPRANRIFLSELDQWWQSQNS